MKALRIMLIVLLATGVNSHILAYEESAGRELDIPEEAYEPAPVFPQDTIEPLPAIVTDRIDPRLTVPGDEETIAPPKEDRDFASRGEAMKFGLKRGAANLFCCWLEIPRNLSYEFTDKPLSAVIIGPLMGASLTALRAVMSVGDLASCGLNGYYSYGALPTYPWEGPWLSDETKMY